MLFEFEQTSELFTPTIGPGGVNEVNPLLTSSQACRLDENEIDFSEKQQYELVSGNHSHENSDEPPQHQQQEDLFSTFDFPVLTELSRTGRMKLTDVSLNDPLPSDSTFDGITLEKYINQGSFPSAEMDLANISVSEDSTFYPVEDEESTTNLWVGNECTIESKSADDMSVPPSPPLSSDGSVTKTKKRCLTTSERKLRKKDQNKSAAEKYRLKKRTERTDLSARQTTLKTQNQELKFQLENLTFQLEQFKQLFADVLQIPIPSK